MSTTINGVQKFEKTEIEKIFEDSRDVRAARSEACKKHEENKRVYAELCGARKLMDSIRDRIAIGMVMLMAGISIIGSLMMTLSFLANIGVPATGTGMFIIGVIILALYAFTYLRMFEYVVKRIVKKRK